MNNVTLIGNVCRDFELRQTNSGTSISSNTIAVRRDRKESNGEYASDFFDIYCFGSQADYAVKYLRKGDKIAVSGSVHIRDYTMKNGTKGRAVEVIVTSIESLTTKSEDTQTATGGQASSNPQPETKTTQSEESTNELDSIEITDDDLPF